MRALSSIMRPAVRTVCATAVSSPATGLFCGRAVAKRSWSSEVKTVWQRYLCEHLLYTRDGLMNVMNSAASGERLNLAELLLMRSFGDHDLFLQFKKATEARREHQTKLGEVTDYDRLTATYFASKELFTRFTQTEEKIQRGDSDYDTTTLKFLFEKPLIHGGEICFKDDYDDDAI